MPSSSSKPLLPFFFLVIVLLYCADAHRREVHGNDRIFDISHKYSPNMPSWGSNDGLGQFLWLRKSMKNGSIANSSEMKLPSHSGTHVDAPGHFYDYYFDAGFDVDTLDLEVLNANPVHPNSVHLNSAHLNSAHSNSAHSNPAHLNSAHLNSAHSNPVHLNSAHSNPVHLNSAHSNPVPGPALLVDITRDKNITAEVMEALNIPTGTRRVLFRTLNTDRGLMYKKEYDTSYTGFTKDGAKWLVENTDIKLVGIDFLSVATDVDLKSAHLVFLESREIIIVEGLKLEDIQAGIYTLHCLPLRLLGAEGSPIRCILIK